MATYTEEYDAALLETPWLAKSDADGKPYLLKFTRHPTKPGFIALLTDLTKVYFEPLVGIRLLARQREVEEQHGESQRKRDGGGSSLDMGGEEAVTEVLEGLDGLMGNGLDEAELNVASGDLYDLDVVLKSSDTSWVFHMTEIRYGCLEIITRHVIHPLALSITSSKCPKKSTDTQILELVSSKTVLQAVNRHSAYPAASAKPAPPPAKQKDKAGSPSPAAEESTSQASSSKPRLVRRRPRTATPEPEPQPEQTGKSPSPTLRDTSPHHGKRQGKQVESAPQSDDDEMMPEEADSPTKQSPSPPIPKGERDITKSPQRRPPSQEEGDAKEADQDATPEPPAPSAPRPSQKTQQEKDEEEEAELERKREEMKRKMGAGGGGRLVRRRFGR